MDGRVTARNYAAQAERDLRRWAEIAPKADAKFAIDAIMAQSMARLINEAVHFALPDDGRIFDDGLRGIQGQEVRLPYKCITVAYFVNEVVRSDVLVTSAPKRLAIATEATKAEFASFSSLMPEEMRRDASRWANAIPSDRLITVYVVNQGGGQPWHPLPCGWNLPCHGWDDEGRINLKVDPLSPSSKDRPTILVGSPMPVLPHAVGLCVEKYGKQRALQYLVHDISDEVTAVLELCEALTCSNVNATNVQENDEAKNRRRIRDGKLPIYETKVLTISIPSSKAPRAVGAELFDRASPRQHLRRGHIRDLGDGRRIWVSSCVVGSDAAGKVDKSYRVRVA